MLSRSSAPARPKIVGNELFTEVLALPSPVPEPATWGMMLLGFVGLGFAFRQSRRKVSFA